MIRFQAVIYAFKANKPQINEMTKKGARLVPCSFDRLVTRVFCQSYSLETITWKKLKNNFRRKEKVKIQN